MNTNQPIWLTKAATFVIVATAVTCFALLSQTRAVVPPPDGGYPGGNTAEGQRALLSLTTGTYNTAVGFFSLLSNTTAEFNTGVGAGTLLVNTADQNTAVGAGALLSNTTGVINTANGAFALRDNTTGQENTANGAAALQHNTTGSGNTASGVGALNNNTTGANNTATGSGALLNNSAGNSNTAIGYFALDTNTTGGNNVAVGNDALGRNTTGVGNIAIGYGAANGTFQLATANNIIFIGHPGYVGDGSDMIRIGGDSHTKVFIGNMYLNRIADGHQVYVSPAGQLGAITSSQRFKEDIKPMDHASQALFSLKPVTFHYKKEIDPAGRSQFGLVAENVEKVHPDLVGRDKEGKPYGVRYDQVNAMLLNEFLKEHRKVEEQGAAIAELKKEITVLTATVREQAAEIQKVRGSVDIEKPATRLVLNER
jgi:Chaperone of endosialidase